MTIRPARDPGLDTWAVMAVTYYRLMEKFGPGAADLRIDRARLLLDIMSEESKLQSNTSQPPSANGRR